MKKALVYSSLLLGILATSANALDYKVSGSAESFTKAGFNSKAYDAANNQAPTDSFTTLFAQLNLNANLGTGFKVGLGGAIGGLPFDSTRNVDTGSFGSAVQLSYFGPSYDQSKVQNYMIQNVFASYDDNIFYIKAGRYEAGKVGEWFGGYNQGAEIAVQLNVFKIWGFLSNRRGFAYDQWFYDFYRVHGTYANGATRNTYAAGIDANMGGLGLSVFSYLIPNKIVAPGVSITYDTNPDFKSQGFRSVTKLRTLFPSVQNTNFYGDTVIWNNYTGIDKNTATLYIEQKFELDTFNFGAGYYQNFGAANAYIGTWGNPLMLDQWTATAYDIGRSLSDMAGKDAITGFGFFGANYGIFNWKIIARGTNSVRSTEQSLALHLGYQVREDIAVGGKLEWLSDTTKAGYNPLASMPGSSALTANQTDDRSHAFFYMRHTF